MANADLLTYIDPFDDLSICYDGKTFSTNKLDKKSFIGSRVSYSDVILHSFKVPQSMSDDELKTNVEIKMYDDAGLDLQKKYKIIYTKKELDFEENILVEAFAIEIDKTKKSLNNVLAHTKHIDFLALPFLSFTTLYKNKIIEPKNDIFVYIDEKEAFLSIYKDGKYLSTKSLMNLSEIIKKLDIAGVEIDIKELKEHLFTKGLDASLYERGETNLFNELEAQFSAILSKINDIVVYNRSVFGFEKIDRIFLSTQNGRIKGIREFISSFGFDSVEVHDFNLFKEKSTSDFLGRIVTSYIYDKFEISDFRHNLTVLQRELPFYKKESGKIILSACLIVCLSVVYVGFTYYENYNLEKQDTLLQERYDIMKKTQSKYKKKISLLNKELKSVVDEKNKINQRVENISTSIFALESLINKKHTTSKFILEINKLLQKHSLATTNITMIKSNSISIEIIAEYSKRDSITKFMEDLIDNGFIGITTDEIKSDKNIYLSRIEIKK